MIVWLASLAFLSAASVQEPAPWRTDVQAARETALREQRPCVIFLYLDSK